MTRTRLFRCLASLFAALAVAGAGTPATAAPRAVPLNPPTVSSTSWDWYRHFSDPPRYDPPVVVTATGGVAPYSYLWQRLSSTNISASNPGEPSTSFSTFIQPGKTTLRTAVFRCQVTDAAGSVAYAPDVTVTFEQEWGD
ncbi:hypothetical protein [Amycolatopsis vastitatis]|uniref:Ig-like domain-containing protein n=1 Tax=Amycolatopsis vastitatis TaxID=1905142 RepID=A0A229SLH9_9PSEU|nr:hypothetical protein [Amycolatopsis vastitatis]OXM59501.1 hypothetical protein CF165_47290 [Amycolatopsis vastitatis]